MSQKSAVQTREGAIDLLHSMSGDKHCRDGLNASLNFNIICTFGRAVKALRSGRSLL